MRIGLINKLRVGVFGTAVILSGLLGATVHAETLGEKMQKNAGATAGNAGLAPTGATGAYDSQALPKLVGQIIQNALGLLGLVVVVLIIYAGWLWMSSQGDEEKIGKAKGIILSAVIGLALIFAAYAITGFVLNAIIEGSKP